MMRILFLFLIITILLFSYSHAFACTVFNCNRGHAVLVGNNEDWRYSTNVKLWFVTSTGKDYGRVCFGWNQLFFFRQAQGGMNDQGLFFDWALCPKSDPPEFTFKKKIASFSLPDKLLAECATVDEAIAWLKQYNILFVRSHIMLVDKSGNSAVVEWVDGEFKILRKKEDCQVMTNFWLSHPELGNYPCQRYNKVKEMLGNRKEISAEYFTSILKTVAIYERTDDGNESGTVYSNVYDLAKGDIYIYYKRDFENPIKINLKTEIEKGNHSYRLSDLLRK
jgi:predicted choloylglycine hydrolase